MSPDPDSSRGGRPRSGTVARAEATARSTSEARRRGGGGSSAKAVTSSMRRRLVVGGAVAIAILHFSSMRVLPTVNHPHGHDHHQNQQRCYVLELIGNAFRSSSSSQQQQPPSPSPSPPLSPRSPLERLFDETNNGTMLLEWALKHALRLYPSLPHDDNFTIGTPSVAHDSKTNRTLLGFRVQSASQNPTVLLRIRYLMLCQPAPSDISVLGSSLSSLLWRCQDSGWDNSYVPPECAPTFWVRPRLRLKDRHIMTGPEDARLYWDSSGNLGAVVMMRGCHPLTKYGKYTALWSVYVVTWSQHPLSLHDTTTWRMVGLPQLLDVRKSTATLENPRGDDDYPDTTKNWIPIPLIDGVGNLRYAPLERTSAPSSEAPILYSVGWTANMKEHVLYKIVNDPSNTETLLAVAPARSGVDIGNADLEAFRGSTNAVEFGGALLALGHRIEGGPVISNGTYQHYWYAFCPFEPYEAVALSDPMALADGPQNRINFALGLARVGDDHLYFTYSVWDRIPYLRRFTSSEILEAFRTSSFAASLQRRTSRGDYQDMASFAALCNNSAAGATETA